MYIYTKVVFDSSKIFIDFRITHYIFIRLVICMPYIYIYIYVFSFSMLSLNINKKISQPISVICKNFLLCIFSNNEIISDKEEIQRSCSPRTVNVVVDQLSRLDETWPTRGLLCWGIQWPCYCSCLTDWGLFQKLLLPSPGC